jgi:hypothetical protein
MTRFRIDKEKLNIKIYRIYICSIKYFSPAFDKLILVADISNGRSFLF